MEGLMENWLRWTPKLTKRNIKKIKSEYSTLTISLHLMGLLYAMVDAMLPMSRPTAVVFIRILHQGYLIRFISIISFPREAAHPLYICRISLPTISGLSTSHSSLRTANVKSDTNKLWPKLHTSVMA